MTFLKPLNTLHLRFNHDKWKRQGGRSQQTLHIHPRAVFTHSRTSYFSIKHIMATNIIQHHELFDFESFFENIKSQYIGLDYHDYLKFMHTEGEKHSFIGRAERKDRVKNALENAIASDEAVEIINRASSVMINIISSSEARRPLTMEEMQHLNEFITGISENCDVVWGLTEDDSLGDAVKVIILVDINDKSWDSTLK